MQPTRVAVVRVRDDIAGAMRRGIDPMGGMGRYVRQYGLDGSIYDLNYRRPRTRTVHSSHRSYDFSRGFPKQQKERLKSLLRYLVIPSDA
jgi:hypothetical protein